MTKKEKLLKDISEICYDHQHVMEILMCKALYLYTSVKNLEELKKFAIADVENEKKFEEKENE